MHRHPGLEWLFVHEKLETNTEKLQVLGEMERTGGEPDVIGYKEKTGELIFCDCSPESPTGRRSLCYDREALDKRKENKPSGNAIETAALIGTKSSLKSSTEGCKSLENLIKKPPAGYVHLLR